VAAPISKPSDVLIVLVEDDKSLAEMVTELFSGEGFRVKVAGSVFQGRGLLQKHEPHVVILDRKLPDGDGMALCQELRGDPKRAHWPILFLSSKKSTSDKVAGLTVGADDYLAKPFEIEELLARVKALLRRSAVVEPENATLTLGDLALDLDSRKVRLKGKAVALGTKEFDLLEAFLRNRNKVLTRQVLLERVWGYEEGVELSTRVVDVTISHLRAKLGALGARIVSVPNYGYRLDDE
jgi:DNA-binding response OmpR family regulator